MKNKILLATRTQYQQDSISDMIDKMTALNAVHKEMGLPAVINLSLGEPHLPMPAYVAHKLIEFLGDETAATAFSYSPSQGSRQILDAISQLYRHYYPRLNYTQAEVMICNGAAQGLFNALSILLNPEDEVVVFAPYFCMYEIMVQQLNGTLVVVPTKETHFKPSPEKLRATLTAHPKAKAIIFNYPNNPTGVTLSEDDAKQFADVLNDFPRIAIIIDDVYRELSPDHVTVVDVDPKLYARSIVINSASKGLIGAPGMRIGMVGANAEWIKKMTLIQTSTVNSIPYLSELILHAAITYKIANKKEYRHWLAQSKKEYTQHTNYISHELSNLGFNVVAGNSGFFIFADASFLKNKKFKLLSSLAKFKNMKSESKIMQSLQPQINSNGLRHDHDIAIYLLHAANVAVVPGSAFGMAKEDCYLRFSCARPLAELEQAMAQFTTVLQSN